MSGWALFWKIVLLAAFFSYFGLAIVLTIGGFFDVKKMFRRLAEAARHSAPPPSPLATNVPPPSESAPDASPGRADTEAEDT